MQTPLKHIRSEDQTFLTMPEWFLVYSSEEYAEYLKDGRPSEFPFFGHIKQFWQTYNTVLKATHEKYSINWGYQVMLLTIGVSTTVEYTIKGLYGMSVGKWAEGKGPFQRSKEDMLGADIAQEYLDFIKVDPWYKFDFWGAFKRVWKNNSAHDHTMRKWERRIALSVEYLTKSGYAWLIRKATQASFDAPIHRTATVVWTERSEEIALIPEFEVTESIGNNLMLMLPRYANYTESAIKLSNMGTEFISIAGNEGGVAISIIAKTSTPDVCADNILMKQEIITKPGHHRIHLIVPIKDLNQFINQAGLGEYKVEHIYDF